MCRPALGVILSEDCLENLGPWDRTRLLEVTAQKRTVAGYVLLFAGFFLLLYLRRSAQLPLFSAPSHSLLPSAHVAQKSPALFRSPLSWTGVFVLESHHGDRY